MRHEIGINGGRSRRIYYIAAFSCWFLTSEELGPQLSQFYHTQRQQRHLIRIKQIYIIMMCPPTVVATTNSSLALCHISTPNYSTFPSKLSVGVDINFILTVNHRWQSRAIIRNGSTTCYSSSSLLWGEDKEYLTIKRSGVE